MKDENSCDFLSAMIADFPGSAAQKAKAKQAAMRFMSEHGVPPYATMSKALDFFSTMMKAAGK